MMQSAELKIDIATKQNTFLIQHTAKTVPMPLHCLHMQLITDYYFCDGLIKEYFQVAALKDEEDKSKLQDHSMTMLYFLIMSLQPR
jgi:alpha-1,4-galacturonosyltransferase